MSNHDLEVMANERLQAEVVALRTAADALASAAKRVYESSRIFPWDPAEKLIIDPKLMAQLRDALREYREATDA